MPVLLHPAIPKVRRYVYRVLGALNVAFSWRRQTIVLAYHGIGQDEWRFGVLFDDFCQQIERVMRVGYQPVKLEEIFRHIETGATLPKKSFAVTFDDGYRDVLLVKHYLKKKGIQPTVFVLAEPEAAERNELGTGRQFLSPREIVELHTAGWEIGCHSATHADFSQLDTEALEREVTRSKNILEKNLALNIRYFAYPKGFYDSRIRAAVKKAGYAGALSMDDGFIGSSTDVFAVPRIGVDRTHTDKEFNYIFLPSVVYFRQFVKAVLSGIRILRLSADRWRQSSPFIRNRKYKTS